MTPSSTCEVLVDTLDYHRDLQMITMVQTVKMRQHLRAGYFHLPDVMEHLQTTVLWIISSILVDHHALAGDCCDPVISEHKSLKSTAEKRREMDVVDQVF